MNEASLRKYLKAGEIASKVVEYAKSFLSGRSEINLTDLCERIERKIESFGGKPAFPCNLGLNEVAAHFSPYPGENLIIERSGILKIDLGVRIDGCIADVAFSIALSSEYKELVECAEKALANAIEVIKPGIRVSEVGRVVEDTAKEMGFKPIKNLSGHLIEEYKLHAGKSIPNVKTILSDRMEVGEVYAVEPFITLGEAAGEVIPINKIRIYQIMRIKKLKDPELEKCFKEMVNEFKTLPFTPRWLTGFKDFKTALRIVEDLRKLRLLYGFPVLVEKSLKPVAQFEHTVVIREGGVITLTKPSL